MPFVPCEQCGKMKEYSKSRLQRNTHNFCSKECRNKWMSINLVGENHPHFGKKRPESTGKKISKKLKNRVITPEWRENIRQSRLGTHATQATKDLMSEQRSGENHPLFGTHRTDETKQLLRKANIGKKQSKDTSIKKSKANKKRFEDPEERKRMGELIRKYFEDPEKRKERGRLIQRGVIDHKWFGDIVYLDKTYCEKWNAELRRRIRAYWGNKSVLSGKTITDNNNKRLSCHHVYYQEKACCVWDEDTQGYYAWIDIGTRKKSNKIKYYIKGDPNKFVTLTEEEHGMVGSNKLKWIKIFEDLIEEQDGKCYFTKEEMKEIEDDLKAQIQNGTYNGQF